MRNAPEDSLKSRLTDRAQLMLAVEKLRARGVPEELVPVHLARAFYVDLDELNAVLAKAAGGKAGLKQNSSNQNGTSEPDELGAVA